MSSKFELVKHNYNTFIDGERLWNKSRVRNAVIKGWITSAEYEEIVGEPYPEPNN